MQLVGTIIAAVTIAQSSAEGRIPAAPGNHLIEAGFFVGAFLPSKDHELYDSLGTDHREFGTVAPEVGLRLSYFPVRFLGIEAEGAYMPTWDSAGDLAHLYTVRGHGVVQWPGRLTPFALAGGGMVASAGAPGNDVDESFHWGLGAKFYIDHWLSVRLDGRQIYTAGVGPGAGNTSHFEVVAGLSFTLYREDPEEPWTVADIGPYRRPSAVGESVRRETSVATSPAAVIVRKALGRVHFAFGSAELRSSSYSSLDLAAEVLRQNPRLRVEIVGHTDHVGTEAYNQDLSERRANAVKNYLVEMGVHPSRLRCQGMGETAPVAPNDSVDGRARNRRSEITVTNSPAPASQPASEAASQPESAPDDNPPLLQENREQ